MSNECSTIVWKRQFGSMTRKLIAARLADHADDEGRGIWPSAERVAAQCDTTRRTVQRTLDDFVKEGLLTIVHPGGNGPGDTRRYDFNMIVLKALPLASWGDKARETPVKNDGESGPKKGDSVSPLPGAKGDTETNKGDTDDKKGCHGVTQTTIEPSNNPQKARERVREDAQEAQRKENGRDAKQAEKLFWKLVKEWPGFDGMPKEPAKLEFLKLSDTDQEQALARRDDWFSLLRSQGKDYTPAPSTYCRETLWKQIPADFGKEQKTDCELAKPFGKMWGALRFSDLMREPYGHFPPLTIMQQKLIEQGGAIADRERLERKSRYGWPKVNTMHERAIRKHAGVSADLSLAGIADLFGGVQKGSDLWCAWKAYHEQRGWPWFGADRECPVWVYLPEPPEAPDTYASPQEAVSAAMARFETEHATITERQAAE